MEKIKALEEGHEKSPPAAAVVAAHEAHEKSVAPQTANRLPADAHAASLSPAAAAYTEGAVEQARQVAAMQRRVGNARLARLLAEQSHASARHEKDVEDAKRR